MKQKKALLKKFHRKYVFLQNSLVHFLDWRVSEFSNFMTLKTYNDQSKPLFFCEASGTQKNKKNSFHFLEQEKICFQDYWKNSEHKKIENAIENMNKGLITSKNSYEKKFLNFSKKRNVFNIQKKSFYAQQKVARSQNSTTNKQKISFFVDTKKMSMCFSSKKFGKQSKQGKYLKILGKSQFSSSNNLENFIPKSDILRKQNFFFANQKIGEFFPKKKNFTQYWIFPLLGFVVFFHSAPTFFDSKFKQVFDNSLSFPSQKHLVNAQTQLQASKNSTFAPTFSKFSSFFIDWKYQPKNFSLDNFKQQNLNSIFDFSYTNRFSKETYNQMKNLENLEFEKFCDFSFKIFQNSPHFFLVDLLNNSASTHNKEIKSLLCLYNKNSFKKDIYKKIIETKRNTFHWKWFALSSQSFHFLSSQQNEKASYLSVSEVPQKAQFFTPIFENNFLFDFTKFHTKTSHNFSTISNLDFSQQTSQKWLSTKNNISSQTPLFNFSKTRFLFNEFERNLNNSFHIDLSNKNENLTFLNDIVSLSTVNTESPNFHFFNMTNSLFEFSKNSSFFDINILQNYTKNALNNDKKNSFYLTKWLQTQSFWKVKKNSPASKFSLNFSKFKKNSIVKKLQNSLKISNKYLSIENFMNLDFIYFRKLFSSLSVPKEHIKSKTLNTLSNFSQFSKSIHDKKIVTHSKKPFSNAIIYNKKTPYFFALKKQTFEFFTFQHYKNNYKTLINNLLTNVYRDSQQKNKMKHRSFTEQKTKNLFPIVVNKFHQNILRKNQNAHEKNILNNFKNSSKINNLKIPIFLNFSNKKSFSKLDIHFQNQNRTLSKNQITFPSSYSMNKDENLEARPNNLKSIYFHLLQNKKLSSIRQNFFESKKFLKSKIDFVQTIYAKTLTNIKKNEFFSFATLQLESFTFQNHFLFEKIKKEKPFIFHNHENFSPLVFLSPHLKVEQSVLKSAKFFVLKQKTASAKQSLQKTATKTQFFKNSFTNFQSKKYEKIFKTFLTPLNKKQQNFKKLYSFDKKTSNIDKLEKREILSKFKTSKDILLLESLSASVQENLIKSNSPFFISFHRKKQTQENKNSTVIQNFSSKMKNNTNDKFENYLQSNLFSPQFKENQQIKIHENFKNQKSKSLFSNRTTKVLYPSFILKRDGFVFFPPFMPFDEIQTEQKSTNLYFPIQQKDTNSFSLKRLEQEKSFQKKRRMKKQKLETRRRKKRKRFFPRPIWLRFHLYKKFLKTRHPHLWSNDSVSLENEKKNRFIASKSLSFQPQNIFVLFPKKSKYQNIKAFSKNKTNSFIFHFSNTKKWKNILYSPFLKRTLCFQKVDTIPTKLGNYEKNNFIHQNNNQNLSTVFKYLNKNSLFFFSQKKSSVFKIASRFARKNNNEFSGNKIYRKNQQNWGFSWKKKFLASSEKHFYKKLASNGNFHNQTNFINKFSPMSQNLDHYKISGEILSEFVRLSWKSYWFLTNFQPYTKRITQNLRKMQKLESERNFSNLLTPLSNKKPPMLFQSLPIFQNHYSNYSQDLLLRNSVFRKFAWYCNIKNSLEENSVLGNSFNQLNQKSLNYQNIQNFPEYNRILYSRVSEILRNFKSLENTDDQSMYMRNQKNLNIPKRKNEIISSNSSFFTKNALFFENFHIPSQPSIPAFSLFSSIFNDSSIKPTGEIPTLRSLWALHRTNLYHFQEKNAVRHLWTLKKRTDSLKSFKGAKKAVHFLKKYSGLEKLNSPQLLNQFTSKDFFFNSMQKDKIFQEENFYRDQRIYPLVQKSNYLIFENLTNKKKFFVSNLKSGFYDFVQQLDTMCLQKFLNSQKKCSLFGIHTVQQNSKVSLRYLKFHLFSNSSKKDFLKSAAYSPYMQDRQLLELEIRNQQAVSEQRSKSGTLRKNFKNFVSSGHQKTKQLEYSFVAQSERNDKNKDLNQQNSSKSSLNFWWSQKNFSIFDFFMGCQNTRLNSLQFIPFFSNELSFHAIGKKTLPQPTENVALNNKNYFSENFNFPFLQIELKDTNKNKYFSLQTQILWFGAILFHLALFFTILKLPEIRSVLKFQCILFSKFFAGFFFILFSIYNFFKKYTKKGTFVANKILSNTSSFVHKSKSLDAFSFDLDHSSKFQNFIFSRNKNLQEKNLINLLFYFEDYKKSSVHLRNSLNSKKSLSKNLFFELFFRLSKFSSFFSKNQYLKNEKTYKNLNLFFISVHNFYSLKNFSSLEKEEKGAIKNVSTAKSFIKISKNFIVPIAQKFPMTFLKNSKSVFHFKNSSKQFDEKNVMDWKNSKNNDFLLSFYSYSQIRFTPLPIQLKPFYNQSGDEFLKQKFLFDKNKQKLNIDWQKVVRRQKTNAIKHPKSTLFVIAPLALAQKAWAHKKSFNQQSNAFKNFKDRQTAFHGQLNKPFSNQLPQQRLKKFQTLSKNEKFICQLALSFLFIGKSTTLLSSNIVQFGTNVSSKVLDFVEAIMFSIYKFLEKPAEVLIEWIAFIFLIEWSSDIATFVPDTLDISLAKSSQKLHRPVRSGSFFLNFLNSRNENLFFYFYPSFGANYPGNVTNFFGFWSYVNFASFLLQKRIVYFFENFCTTVLQPDMDLLTRQRKGIIFWDIWAEILLKAAEKYNVNIPSFVTLKEEQELFIEKLLQDKEFLKNLQNQTQQYQQALDFNKKDKKLNLNTFGAKHLALPLPSGHGSKLHIKDQQGDLGSANHQTASKSKYQQQRKTLNGESVEQNSLTLFIENFIEKERFQQFSEFSSALGSKNMNKNKQNIEQLAISDYISSQSFESNSSFLTNQQSFYKNIFEMFSSTIPIRWAAEHSITGFTAASKQFVNLGPSGSDRGSLARLVHLCSTSELTHQQKFLMLFSNPIFVDSFSSGADFYSSRCATNFDRSFSYGGNQFGTYQGPETDLFVDIHPPKSLKHIQFSKYYEPAQYTLGSLICQVYSGLFSKQISKNILVIGAPGTAKTLFIQALAGETEMKMITDNAYRYSMVLRGVAVGMKYLRDVFDALALQTPCFFLMEHIHVLGSKRPFLISDDENIKGIQANVGLEQQEVHETNQMIYQLNRHSIVDYKRPYKGDFSMGIPTNFFVQRFYSNSENNSNSIFLSSGPAGLIKNSIFSVGVNAQNRNPISPLPVDSIEHSLVRQGFAEKEKTDNAFQNIENNQKQNSSQSRLQMVQEQIFAPPATSPFTILMMKEQKKLKPKKIVQENSWGGLSTDQLVSYQKESFSVRAKVALLADITMNLSRGKLDMITDLLVIIDSVRSNRGFVVFATTHLPSLLDPALRRPGRFDETISLAQSPNFLNRFEILKTNFQNSLTTLDFLDSSIFTENLSEMNLLNFIMGTKLSFFHQYKYTSFQKASDYLVSQSWSRKQASQGVDQIGDQGSTGYFEPLQKLDKLKSKLDKRKKLQQRFVSQIYPTKAFHSFLKSSFFYDLYNKKAKPCYGDSKQNLNSPSSANSAKQSRQLVDQGFNSKYFLRHLKLLKYTILPKGPSHILNFAYSKIGIFLAQSNLLQDPTAFSPLSLDTNSSFASHTHRNIQFLGNVLYDSQKQQKLQFMIFLSGKIAEFCVQKNTLNSQNQKVETFYSNFSLRNKVFSKNKLKNLNLLQKKFSNEKLSINSIGALNKPSSLFHYKFSLFSTSFDWQNEKISNRINSLLNLQQSKLDQQSGSVEKYQQNNFKNRPFNLLKNQSQTLFVPKCAIHWVHNKHHDFSMKKKAASLQKTDFSWTAFGNNQNWRFITPFLFSIIQKRFLFTKNLLLSKMLFFDNKNTRKLPPSPPSSSILMPSKKFENFKRTENDFVQKSRFSINEKIQMHQQQRFLKQLYNIPIQQYFRSEMIENRTTLFSSSYQELAYLDSLTRRFSSSHFYQRKFLVIRHRFSNTNQWWNGLLPEHNTETTYLSDVDWRTMFGNTTSKQKSSYLLSFQNNSLEQASFSKEKLARNNVSAADSVSTKHPVRQKSSAKKQNLLFEKDKNQTFEFIMDFPDAEQYYNPRNRRWYLNSNFHFHLSDSLKTSSLVDDKEKSYFGWQNQKIGLSNKAYGTKNLSISAFDIHQNSSYWLTFDKTLQYEIYYHYLMQSFHETFHYFNTNREMLDLFVFQLLRKGFLKELDYLMTVSRF
uniref:cell division protein n=1 Tax=Coelastrella saipanensis TaxID=152631 RepID=UPI0010C28D2F|nr:cell division protein [Coelastrella saipanensis]AVV61539.1 cell division protein [Coelastrella saipanensis]